MGFSDHHCGSLPNDLGAARGLCGLRALQVVARLLMGDVGNLTVLEPPTLLVAHW